MSLFEKAKSIPRGAEIISGWLGDGGIPVDPENAQRRADICLKCPMNNIQTSWTDSVAQMIRRAIEVKNSLSLRVKGEKALGECRVCLCSLRLKVHTPIQFIRKREIEGERELLPPNCWQRTEQ